MSRTTTLTGHRNAGRRFARKFCEERFRLEGKLNDETPSALFTARSHLYTAVAGERSTAVFTPFLFGGIEFLIPLVLILLVVLVVRQSGNNDRHGHRPYAVYLFIVTFISLMTVLGALGFLATVIGNQATNSRTFVTGEQCVASFSGNGSSDLSGGQFVPVPPQQVPPPENCRPTGPTDAPVAIRAILIAFVAGGVLWFHATQARALLDKERAHA